MKPNLGPGPASIEGLRWLCRVGPAPFDAWRAAMGWAPGTTRWHITRLMRAEWIDRIALPYGQGSMLFPTREGIAAAAMDLPFAAAPSPTWWAHHAGCAWTAAWLSVRGRAMLGPRELASKPGWHGALTDLPGPRRVMHTPDLVGTVPGHRPAAIEVELKRKTKARLRAILALHARWIAIGQSGACVYVCANTDIRELVVNDAAQAGLTQDAGTLRVEMLDTIKQLAAQPRPSVLRGTPAVRSLVR